jgi:PAS domain S-box-containing protein
MCPSSAENSPSPANNPVYSSPLSEFARLRLFEAFVDQCSEAILITRAAPIDPPGPVIEFVNDAFTRMTGYHFVEVFGKTPRLLQGPLTSRETLDRIRRALESWQLITAELVNYRKDGSPFWVELKIFPVRDDKDWVTHWVSVQRDITESKIIAETQQKQWQLQKLEAVAVLAGGVAHDYNNLLTGILGNADLLRTEIPPNTTGLEFVTNIEKLSERAADLCRQMLAYAGKGRFFVEPIDLNEVLEDTLLLFRKSLPNNVHLNASRSVGSLRISADRAQMQQLLMNLLINATEAIGENAGTITVNINRKKASGPVSLSLPATPTTDVIELTVSDNGCGMDDAVKARMYEPFFTTKFTGRGLGLSAVLGIVRSHQGTIEVASEPGKGSSFLITFASLPVEVQNPAPVVNNLAPWRGAGKVLVVDDETAVRGVAVQLTRSLGFDVDEAVNGNEGLQLGSQKDHRLILLDWAMPDMDGLQVLEQLRKIGIVAPVVVMSGFSEIEVRRRFEQKGLNQHVWFLQKPFARRELGRKLREALGQ